MIGFANWEDRPALAALWQISFDEERRYANFFFNNRFLPENCLVYRSGNKVAAMMHLLPAWVVQNGKPVRAHYVFACATQPEHRSHGYMNALLAYAALVGTQREEQYSVILPANRSLYKYYAKSDYQTFFERDEYELSDLQMRAFASERLWSRAVLPPGQLNGIRDKALQNQNGSVLWDDISFWFAVQNQLSYGGKLVCAEGAQGDGYALCRTAERDTCEVTELMSSGNSLPNVLAGILKEMPAPLYRLRLPKNSGLLKRFAREPLPLPSSTACGMIKPLGGVSLEQLNVGQNAPYLGLGKD